MSFRRSLAALAVASACFCSPAGAVPLVPNGDFEFFSWDLGVSTDWEDTYSFTLSQPGTLQVVDFFIVGDRFEVFANGSSLGQTSVPVDDGSNIGNDFEAALASPDVSSASFPLAPGSYVISGIVIDGATGFSAGAGGIRVLEAAVPLPGALVLMLSGLAAVGLVARRKAA